MKKWLLILCILITFLITGCGFESEKPSKDIECEHQWHDICYDIITCDDGSEIVYTIYCPLCKQEIKVTSKDWHKCQVDQELAYDYKPKE